MKEHFVTILEADGLLVPVQLIRLEDSLQHFEIADFKVILRVKSATAAPLKAMILDIGVVEDVEAFFAEAPTGQPEHEIHTVVVPAKREVLRIHLVKSIESFPDVKDMLSGGINDGNAIKEHEGETSC